MTKNVNEIPISSVLGGFGEKTSNGGTQWFQQDRVYDAISDNVVAMCHPSGIPGGSYRYLVREDD